MLGPTGTMQRASWRAAGPCALGDRSLACVRRPAVPAASARATGWLMDQYCDERAGCGGGRARPESVPASITMGDARSVAVLAGRSGDDPDTVPAGIQLRSAPLAPVRGRPRPLPADPTPSLLCGARDALRMFSRSDTPLGRRGASPLRGGSRCNADHRGRTHLADEPRVPPLHRPSALAIAARRLVRRPRRGAS